MTGGSGVDWFVYDEASASDVSGVDVIIGTEQQDRIWIPSSWSPSLYGGGLRNGQFAFVNGTTAQTPETRFFIGRGGLYFDSDGSGSAPAIKLAEIHGITTNYMIQIYDL